MRTERRYCGCIFLLIKMVWVCEVEREIIEQSISTESRNHWRWLRIIQKSAFEITNIVVKKPHTLCSNDQLHEPLMTRGAEPMAATLSTMIP